MKNKITECLSEQRHKMRCLSLRHLEAKRAAYNVSAHLLIEEGPGERQVALQRHGDGDAHGADAEHAQHDARGAVGARRAHARHVLRHQHRAHHAHLTYNDTTTDY